MQPTLALTWLLLLPLVASPVIYLAGRISVRLGASAAPARWLAALSLAATCVPLWFVGEAVLASGPVSLTVGAISMRMDGVGLVVAATVMALTLLVSVFSIPYIRDDEGEEKYYALLVAMAATMVGLASANDLFNLWVWFEAMAVTSFLLVAFYRDQRGALEAGVKYLVQSAVGSALVLIGIAFVFAQTGTLDLQQVAATAARPTPPQLLAAGALFLIGFGVKTALVPLHTWLPDAHSQAPSGVSAMLSGVVIEAGLVAMLRSLGCLAPAASTWGAMLLAFGALNMIVGNLMALRQTQVKRMFAYSSVSHMGYMLVGFGVAVGYGVVNGAAGGFFHLLNHALMKGLAFLAAGVLLYTLHIARGSHAPLTVTDLDGAGSRYPVTAFALSVAVLALGGLPPLSGFMSKWQIFVAGFETRSAGVELLVVFAAINSVLSLAYYAPLVNRMYRHQPSTLVASGRPVPLLMAAPVVVLTVFVLVLGFWPGLVDAITHPAAVHLVSIFGGAGALAQFYGRLKAQGPGLKHGVPEPEALSQCEGTMDLLLSPPFAFLAYIPVALALLGLGRLLAGPASPNAMKSSIYGSGEASPTFEAAPGYQPFFLIALFFAVVHLAMLVLGVGSLPMPAAVYLVGLFIALVALILG